MTIALFTRILLVPVVVVVLAVLSQTGCGRVSLAPSDPTADNLSLTLAKGALPREACKARLSFAYEAPTELRVGQRASIHILVSNAGTVVWPYAGVADGKFQVHLGNHWIDQNLTRAEDARSSLSYDLRPGAEEEMMIVITAPSAPGNYILEFDMVQEWVVWFGELGSETLKTNVKVEALPIADCQLPIDDGAGPYTTLRLDPLYGPQNRQLAIGNRQ